MMHGTRATNTGPNTGPGATGIEPPGATQIRTPDATGIRPPGATRIVPPGATRIRIPPDATRIEPPGATGPDMLWCDTITSLLAAQTSATNTGPPYPACAYLVPTSCRTHRELHVIERNVKSHLLDTGICR